MICLFFKQKTEYELRISDWSSDVCSADLPWARRPRRSPGRCSRGSCRCCCTGWCPAAASPGRIRPGPRSSAADRGTHSRRRRTERRDSEPRPSWLSAVETSHRSDEQTSELQSLKRTSYAVISLKQKKTRIQHSDTQNQ